MKRFSVTVQRAVSLKRVDWCEVPEGGEGALADSKDENGYEGFFDVAKRSLMSQAFLFTGDVEDSRDLVQEVLFRAWREWPRISQYEDPQGWARRVLHNLTTDHWRQKRGRHLVRLEPDSVETRAPGVGHLDIVAALHRLSRSQQRALVLHDVVGLSVVEVAAELNAPTGTVRSWLSRGRAALAEDLGLSPTVGEEVAE
jgi:RNA polymerase sigma-70 factor (ECF subfamily)